MQEKRIFLKDYHAEIVSMIADNYRVDYIASRLKCSKEGIWRYINNNNLDYEKRLQKRKTPKTFNEKTWNDVIKRHSESVLCRKWA